MRIENSPSGRVALVAASSTGPGRGIEVPRGQAGAKVAMNHALATIPIKRWGSPADGADALLYFARDKASFVNGQSLCMKGGKTPWHPFPNLDSASTSSL